MFQNRVTRIFLRILSCFAVLFCVLYLTGYAVAFFVLPDTSIEVSQGLILCGVYALILGIAGVLLYLWMPAHGALIRTLCFLVWCWFYLMCIVKASLFNNVLQGHFTYNGIPFFSIASTLQSVQSGILSPAAACVQFGSAFFLCWPVCITLTTIGDRLSRSTQWMIACSVPIVLELLQALLRRGSADIDDVILGLAGIALYALLACVLRKRAGSHPAAPAA